MATINDLFYTISASKYAGFNGYMKFAESVNPTFNQAMSTSFAEQYCDHALTYLKSNAQGSIELGRTMQFNYQMDFPHLKTNDVLNPAWKCLANFSNQNTELFYEMLSKRKTDWKRSDTQTFLAGIECTNNSPKRLKQLLLDSLKKYGFTKINESEWCYEVDDVSMILRPNVNFRSRVAPFQFNIRYVSKETAVYFFLEDVVPGLQAYTVHKDFCESSLYISSRLFVGTVVAKYLAENLQMQV
jgi:hypothetical protein